MLHPLQEGGKGVTAAGKEWDARSSPLPHPSAEAPEGVFRAWQSEGLHTRASSLPKWLGMHGELGGEGCVIVFCLGKENV